MTSAFAVVRTPVSTSGVHRFHRYHQPYSSSTSLEQAKPKSGNIVESYQTVSVNCAKCGTKLFRYKKKNGTKSNLVKLYIERITEDYHGLLLLTEAEDTKHDDNNQSTRTIDNNWECPNCQTSFARPAVIHGRPALKLVGGKTRMTKK